MSNTPKERHGLMDLITSMHDEKSYQDLTWEGTLSDYLHTVEQNPRVARTAFQRVYDMILLYGYEEYTEYK